MQCRQQTVWAVTEPAEGFHSGVTEDTSVMEYDTVLIVK